MADETISSDSLEQSVDSGIDKAIAAKGAYDTAQNIGATAAEAGKAAAESAAAADAGAGAAAGTGAAVGTAAGPGGTVMGAVIGLAAGLLAKPIIKGLIVITVVVIMVFSSLPSMFFENPEDMADNTGPREVYQQFKDYAMAAYRQEIENRKQDIENDFQRRIDNGEFDGYDHVEYSYSFIPPEDVFLAELREACVLIIAMFEIHTDDWRKASFEHFRSAVDSVNFWYRTVEAEKKSEEHDVTWDDDDESTIHVTMVYNIYDKGVEQFRQKFGLADEKEFIKSAEMAYNIKLFFGEADGLPMGGVSSGGSSGFYPGGGSTSAYPGGGTHNAIRQALVDLDETKDFFGGFAALPLNSYYGITSEFGPRNYAPDPIHTGLDFSADSGTPIHAAMDGIVLLRLTNYQTFGNHIVVYHGGGVTTMYAHMSSFGSYQVGQPVERGDVIGYVGQTGLATGDHLHFEYQKNGTAYNPRLILPLS